MEAMPITAYDTDVDGYLDESLIDVKGSLKQCLDHLMLILQKDQATNGQKDFPFRYEVTVNVVDSSCIDIDTIVEGTGNGGVRYGRVIRRVGHDLYALWIDD